MLLADYEDAIVKLDVSDWPPPALVAKLVADDRQSDRWPPEVQAVATERLGFYCPLQSVNSEDAMTWSVFGPVMYGTASDRVSLLNWICDRSGLPSENSICAVDLWRTIAHPQKPAASNGPELDAVLVGDRAVAFVEAKWGSPEGTGQGPSGTATQMQLRREYLDRFGAQVFGERHFIVLGVVLEGAVEKVTPPDSERVVTRSLTWADLCDWNGHPMSDQLRAYYEWKLQNSSARAARALAASPES